MPPVYLVNNKQQLMANEQINSKEELTISNLPITLNSVFASANMFQ